MKYIEFLNHIDNKIPSKIGSEAEFEKFQSFLINIGMIAESRYTIEFQASMFKYGINSKIMKSTVKQKIDKIESFFIDMDRFEICIMKDKQKIVKPLLTIEYFLSNILNLKKDVFYYLFLGYFLNPVNFETLQLYIHDY